jgi:hypothetical protein
VTVDPSLPTAFISDGASWLLQQGGTYYRYFLPDSFDNALWKSLGATGLQAVDFGLVDFTTGDLDLSQHPDFVSGPAIQFGYTTPTFWDFPGQPAGIAFVRADNLVFDITSAAPEPGSMALMGAGILLLAGRLRRSTGAR